MAELGIYFPDSSTEAGDSRIKYAFVAGTNYPTVPWSQWKKDKIAIWYDPYTEDPWGYSTSPPLFKKGLTNLQYVKWRFDEVVARKDDYEYACFMLGEEFYHPLSLVGGSYAAWRVNFVDWSIEGTLDIGGQHLEALKPWYTRTKGAWDQAWWDGLKASNNKSDPTIIQFSNEYYFKLHKAWVAHVHSIGKKVAIGSLFFADPTSFNRIEHYYGTQECFDWICANYDLITQYFYPMCMPPTVPCASTTDYRYRPLDTYVTIANMATLRSKIKGLFGYNLTGEFLDGYGSGDKQLQFEEFKRVLPYVDIIFSLPYADRRTNPSNLTLMAPRLLEFCTATNCGVISPTSPPPTPPPTIPPTPPPTSDCPTIQIGSVGDAVRKLQTRLKTLGFYISTVDGIFGSYTDTAVRQYQQSKGLTPDGIVGPYTWTSLDVGCTFTTPTPTPPPYTCPNCDLTLNVCIIGKCIPKPYVIYGGIGFLALLLLTR